VQQDELGVAGLAGLAVEDVEPFDLDVPVRTVVSVILGT
jgi:hypothetical protein